MSTQQLSSVRWAMPAHRPPSWSCPPAQEGGPDNNHRGADQWLFVVEGTGTAIINSPTTGLKAGTMVLIEAGDRHENFQHRPLAAEDRERLRAAGYRDEETKLPAGRAK